MKSPIHPPHLFVVGIKLADKPGEEQTPLTRFNFSASDEERQHNEGLSVEASLAVGVGMFKLEGSGKYLSNTKRSKHEVCFTATYSIENRTRRIPMEVISTIEHARQALDSGATHVVTSVEEGGSASMKFKFLASSAEEAKEISGRLKVVAQIAAVTIEGMAQVVLGNFEAVRQLLSVFDFSSSLLLLFLFLLLHLLLLLLIN